MELKYESIFQDNSVLENVVFTTAEMNHYKMREREILSGNSSSYYRCKVLHEDLYQKIMKIIEPYLTDDMLQMLHHGWYTQLNESMNQSVCSYAPKNRHYSKTDSLKTRVAVAAGVQINGCYRFWTDVFQE